MKIVSKGENITFVFNFFLITLLDFNIFLQKFKEKFFLVFFNKISYISNNFNGTVEGMEKEPDLDLKKMDPTWKLQSVMSSFQCVMINMVKNRIRILHLQNRIRYNYPDPEQKL